jgi:hypothetical protein
MKTGSLWIIRVALTVQFLGVLAVPALVAAAESPRALWMAEWLRPHSIERSIGVLRLRENKLTFVEQIGQVDWELDLARVKKVATVNGGRALLVVSMTGDEYVVTIMEPDLTPGSPRRALNAIERAIELQTANGR